MYISREMKKQPKKKKRSHTYDPKLKIHGTLDDVLKVAALQADKKIKKQY